MPQGASQEHRACALSAFIGSQALLHATAPILLRHRPACPHHVRLHPEPGRRGRAAPQDAQPAPRLPQGHRPLSGGLVVAVECLFTWYWLADLCAREGHPFCPGSCPVHESHPRRQGQKRQDRLPTKSPSCSAAACSPGLCLSGRRCGPPATCSGGACI